MAQRAQLGRRLLGGLRSPRTSDDDGACRREAQRQLAADATARAGDDGHAAGEVEEGHVAA